MGNMVSLKRDNAQSELEQVAMEKPEYEWGTCLHLEGDIPQKLGLVGVSAGDKVAISGMGYIETVTVHDDKEGKRISVSLQLTDMAVDREQQVDAANILYGVQ